jgi:UDP-N-acetylmuramoyl-tripeptide--D-alanyl-D-alanine ligase
MGIITAVGPQHLESFKTIECVQATKFELADALPADGLAIVNDDFEYIANRKVSNTNCVRYAVRQTKNAAVTADNIEYSALGTTFTVKDSKRGDLVLTTKLVGECNISNLTAAVVAARHLGVPDDKIRYAVERIEQVEHRLNIKRTAGGVTIIDDAFNSNPVGSRMALDVIAGMKGGKRIVVTPGMIELGDQQFELNEKFGEAMASSCDIAIVVGQYNREAIVSGLKAGKMAEDGIKEVESFTAAQALLSTLLKSGDIILYENDLPDTFK